MKLALFTPGAYVWPVYRSFERFIFSLGTSQPDTESILADRSYPAAIDQAGNREPGGTEDRRLRELYDELYRALLKPAGFFDHTQGSLADICWPDLMGTRADILMSALTFFFIRQPVKDISIATALRVLRAVFFNHESSEPHHWLHTSMTRLKAERNEAPTASFIVEIPPDSKFDQLHFALLGYPGCPPTSHQALTGNVFRRSDGHCFANVTTGLDPSHQESGIPPRAEGEIVSGLHRNLAHVFGFSKVGAQ